MRTGSLKEESWGAGEMGLLAVQALRLGLGLGLAGEGALRLSAGLELDRWVPPALPLTGQLSSTLHPCSLGKQGAQKPSHRATVSVGTKACQAAAGLVQVTHCKEELRDAGVGTQEPLAQNLELRQQR